MTIATAILWLKRSRPGSVGVRHLTRSVADDRRRVAACRSGDRLAAEELVRRYSDTVYRAVQSTLLSRQIDFNFQDLEDLHNTVFVALFERDCRKLAQFEGRNGCSFKTWIRVVTVRLVLNHLRDKNPHAIGSQHRRVPIEALTALTAPTPGPEAWLQAAQKKGRLDQALTQCSPARPAVLQIACRNTVCN